MTKAFDFCFSSVGATIAYGDRLNCSMFSAFFIYIFVGLIIVYWLMGVHAGRSEC